MMEILEKVSDQVKKVENICSGSVPVLEEEYYTPPVSQMRVNTPIKLMLLQIYLHFGAGTSAEYRRVNRSMALPSGGCFSNPHRGSSPISSDRVSQREACELLEFIGYGEEMSVILRHIKEQFGQGLSKAKVQKEVFLIEQRKMESINQFAGRVDQQFK